MEYMDYEKLSDVIMNISYNTVLKMNVVLGRKDKNSRRIHFYKEFSYNSSKYVNANELYNINRNFDYYLSIEKFENGKDFLMIRNENIMELRLFLNKVVINWLIDDNIFDYRNDKLVLLQGGYKPVEYTLYADKKIIFLPTVIHNIDGTYGKGIRIL